jgi:peptidoglycan biosynthesis protein MviN/MurJ (putative lipid II flippase)
VAVLSFFTRGYLARIIFARSNQEIALIFGFLCLAIFFRIIYTIISRYFYAHKDTKTPLYVSLFVIALNIFLAYSLSKPSVYGVAGLAIAQSIVALTEVFILTIIMIYRDHQFFDGEFARSILRIVSVTGFSAVAGYLAVHYFPLNALDQGLGLIVKLTFITLVVVVVHTSISYVFGFDEAKLVVNRLKRIVFRPVKM